MRRHDDTNESSPIGWIALSDVLMLVAIVCLLLGITTAQGLASRAGAIDGMTRDLEQERRAGAELRQALQQAIAEANLAKQQKRTLENRVTAVEAAFGNLDNARQAADQATRLREDAARLDWAKSIEPKVALARERFGSLDAALQRAAECEASRTEATQLKDRIAAIEASGRQQEKQLGTSLAAATRRAQELEARIANEGELRKELVGLTTNLDRVVFIVDRSESMIKSTRWEWTIQTVARWIELLPVRHAGMIVFSDMAIPIPENKQLLRVTPESREYLLREIRQITPEGMTNTLAALRMACEEFGEVDSIVLFTDGKPEQERRSPEELMKDIEDYLAKRLKKKERTPAINVIGLGDYFNPDYGQFLLRISSLTGGSFIGR